MKRNLMSLLVAAALLTAAPGLVLAQAAPEQAAAASRQGSPSQLVLDNSSRILATLEQRRAEFTANPAALRDFIEREFDTMFDREYAARLVLGKHASGATDAEVEAFADALANSLMQRYGSALLGFDARLQVRMKSETTLPRGFGVMVSSEFVTSSRQAIPVDYLMHRSGGQWKVYDVKVENVSFVDTFRKQFDAELQNKSIAQVTAELRKGQLQADAGQ